MKQSLMILASTPRVRLRLPRVPVAAIAAFATCARTPAAARAMPAARGGAMTSCLRHLEVRLQQGGVAAPAAG